MTTLALAALLLGLEPPARCELSLTAPPECPNLVELTRAVRRCGAAPERPAAARVVIGSHPTGYVAEVSLTLDGRPLGQRLIRPDSSCRNSLEAAAVSICIALDPTFAPPSLVRGEEAEAPGPRRPEVARQIPLPPTRPDAPLPEALPPSWDVYVAAHLSVGGLPTPVLMPRLGGGLGGAGWVAHLDLGVSPVVASAGAELGVALQRVDLRLTGCWNPGSASGRPVRGVAGRLCGLAEVGRIHGVGRGLEGGRERGGGHAVLGAALGAEWVLGAATGTLDLEGGLAVWRTAFHASDENGRVELFRPALWTVGLTLALHLELASERR